MRIRQILISVLTSLLCLGFFCPKAADAAQTPQDFAKEFYEWYLIKHYEHGPSGFSVGNRTQTCLG